MVGKRRAFGTENLLDLILGQLKRGLFWPTKLEIAYAVFQYQTVECFEREAIDTNYLSE